MPERADEALPQRSTIERFFSGLSECIFESKLGVADTQMIDYLSNLLLRFVRVDSMHRVRRGDGRPATEPARRAVPQGNPRPDRTAPSALYSALRQYTTPVQDRRP